ncbi:MAG: MBL fold metallo-hydrolase [Persephonella sp.]|nr:MBL fold metallo-hydrolase [Persephonella sp.]
MQYKGKGFLFDCGEGIQRQIMKAGFNIYSLDYIFISHLHTDHILGLPGLIETLDIYDKSNIKIFSPDGIEEFLKCFFFDQFYTPEIKIEIKSLETKDTPFSVIDNSEFSVVGISLNHIIECTGFSFIEKPKRKFVKEKIEELKLKTEDFINLRKKGYIKRDGKIVTEEEITEEIKGFKFTYIPDTYKTDNIIKLAKDSDILVIECTYLDEEEKAGKYGHLTLDYIIEITPELNCKKIVLTHFSRRYKNLEKFMKKIRKSGLKNIVLGEDFMIFDF